jgi:hypothetical protein
MNSYAQLYHTSAGALAIICLRLMLRRHLHKNSRVPSAKAFASILLVLKLWGISMG